jgi:mono/diheme cytochrome c family protein
MATRTAWAHHDFIVRRRRQPSQRRVRTCDTIGGVRAVLRLCAAACAIAPALAAAPLAQGNPDAARIKNPVAATQESIADGKRLYQRHCASCHGSNGEGGPGNDLIPAAPDLTDKEWKHGSTDGEIFGVIKNGVPPDLNMVPFADQLKDAEIWNVVNYIRSIGKKN